jgi:hypothetical protein
MVNGGVIIVIDTRRKGINRAVVEFYRSQGLILC